MNTKTIVALIALPEESEIFQSIFPYTRDLSSQTTVCLEHNSGHNDIRLISILAQQMGSQSAGESAALAISQFDPNMVVVIGIGGGISNDVCLGDVCVSNEIIDVLHNSKVSEKGGFSDISFAPNFHNIDIDLVTSFQFLVANPQLKPSYEEWRNRTTAEQQNSDIIENASYRPKIYIGPIACGPVSASQQFNERLKALHRKVAAIETESGGVFQKLNQARIPAISIRGISDMADQDKLALEVRTSGLARRQAMFNATTLLKTQLSNPRFLNVASRHLQNKNQLEIGLFPDEKIQMTIVAQLESEICARLKDLSFDFKSRPDGFYLPIPRARRVSYSDELAGCEANDPESIIDCITRNPQSILRLPRSFPSHALGWSLAHSLLRQQIDGKIVLPFVISGSSIRPPQSGLAKAIPEVFRAAVSHPEFIPVLIIEEPNFESRSRLRFLSEELKTTNAKVLIITKSEGNIATVDDFILDNSLVEYHIDPVSFSETAFFLERAFDMSPREAESVAIRLEDTFKRFRLDADPTYFAGLQEDTLAALINANKRAELIQLAVDGLLSMSVAADKSVSALSRTTRESFLKSLVLRMTSVKFDDSKLADFTSSFLKEFSFDTPQSEFLAPFFQIGLLYQTDGEIRLTHPYLESYLLAQALREKPDIALRYFDTHSKRFNYYAFDLYCELGPDPAVISAIIRASRIALEAANSVYTKENIYLSGEPLIEFSNARQIQYLASSLMKNAEKMERPNANDNVRTEKQQIIDARRRAQNEVTQREVNRNENLPEDIREEFAILDALSRALDICVTAIGSGSEALNGETKRSIAELLIQIADRFSDVWTRNRLRIDFSKVRADLLADERIWKFIDDIGAEPKDFQTIKDDLQIFLHGVELNTILEPMGRVLWRLGSNAGVRVLEPVLKTISVDNAIQGIIHGCWYLDVNPISGNKVLKTALNCYDGGEVLRIVLASHLLTRVFWHHYKTASSDHFVSSARRALGPIGLAPNPERIEQANKGVTGTGTIPKKHKSHRKKSNSKVPELTR